jgi:DnaK suppressor protein
MTKRVRLRKELSRQRASLLTDWNLSLASPADRALYADPADQASSDFDQDLAIQVRSRMIARLSRIEHALRLVQTKDYGWCRQCRQAIPFARLAVQPDTLFCVSCLEFMESGR